jgi:transposase
MQNARYDTDLTEPQWRLLGRLVPPPAPRGRPPTAPRRVLDAILYVVKSGCPWRLLPKTFPPWQTVYHVFRRWCADGTWARLNDRLRAQVRAAAGRDCRPTAGILDSQSVKSDPHGGAVGYDAAKRIKGRKRHLLVDTLGLVLGVAVTPAGTPERAGGLALLATVLGWLRWFRHLWVDGGYAGPEFAEQARHHRPKLVVEVVKRSDLAQGFEVLPKRWLVERTFGWLMRHRRLVRDYERTETSAAGWIYVAMIRLMLRRLA